MKPLSIRKVAMAALAVVFLSAFRSDPQRQIPLCTSNGNVHYYFYLDDGDTFDAYNTVGDEITRLEVLLGAFIDTNPSGGSRSSASSRLGSMAVALQNNPTRFSSKIADNASLCPPFKYSKKSGSCILMSNGVYLLSATGLKKMVSRRSWRPRKK